MGMAAARCAEVSADVSAVACVLTSSGSTSLAVGDGALVADVDDVDVDGTTA